MKKALIVGGANGIGLSIATELAKRKDCEKIYIVDKSELSKDYNNATTATAGLMSAADKAKLDSIASGATADSAITYAEIDAICGASMANISEVSW